MYVKESGLISAFPSAQENFKYKEKKIFLKMQRKKAKSSLSIHILVYTFKRYLWWCLWMAKNGPLTMQICKRFSWRGAGKLVLKKDPFRISIFKT